MRAALAAAVCALALGGCAATLPPERCAGADWRAVGLADGAAGRGPEHLETYVEICAPTGAPPDPAAWEEGRRAGLIAYCTPETAFRLGYTGRSLRPVCPAEMAPTLDAANTAGWRRGAVAREIDWLRNERMFLRPGFRSMMLDSHIMSLEHLLYTDMLAWSEAQAARDAHARAAVPPVETVE